MALTRARVVGGDADFAAQVEEVIAQIIALPRDFTEVAREVTSMRKLIAQEKGEDDPWDLKLAAGGLTDLDFLTQALILGHAAAHPDLIHCLPALVLQRAGELGLIKPEHATDLSNAQSLLSRILHWERLTVEGRFHPKTARPPRSCAASRRKPACPISKRLRKRTRRHPQDGTQAGFRIIWARL